MKKVFNRFGQKESIEINYEKETYNKVYQFSLSVKGEILKVCSPEDVECITRNYDRMAEIFATLYSKNKE